MDTLYFQLFMPEIQVTNKPMEANVTEESNVKASAPQGDDADKKDDKVLIKKWGKEAIDVGYTVLPKALLQGQARLKINATDLAVLIHLIEHWWRPGEMPWPKKARIAERLAVTPKTVQRSIARLEAEKLLKRVDRFQNGRRISNEYDLLPLVERIKSISLDMAQAKEEADQAKRKAVRPGARKRTKATV
ncbi:helix-turn-helix domain-containing protein [Shinella lacus]|uniref:helix-turn-helix domain-containing protein n=1 Tax=Shinella lacus TaxID=2654216 RepID=UPI00210AD85D